MSGATRPRFIAVEDNEAPTVAPPTQARDDAARKMLITALTALSQRAVTAITNLFSLFLVSLVFVLFGRILDDPTPNRLAGVGGFAVFCLLTDIVRRRTK
jgi:hypothetical protein